MLKYRFLCLSFVLKILIYSITPTSKYYILLSQGCPLNIIHFSIMSLVLLSDIMFLIDYTYYYINLECFITVRIEKKYYAIILKKLIGGIILLIISSFLIPYYSVDLFFLIILDKLSLLIVFFLILITCLKYKKTDGIVLCYFIMVLLRYMKTFF